MKSVLFAMLAMLFQLQSLFEKLFIFSGKIIDAFANHALKFYHVFLRHNDSNLILIMINLSF
ncbi:MAG: hypothetical protein A2820_00625 [Candidatus Buchananbacteria bacterium RIFCSPHIGHO2_01_FULL_40_35]|nr:MAG: hypothetical protein A2820_00625 [Candidatus Buchananbacteria bacterium RIFCSPHIGHO2_01_FULL_40_35]